jgi:hypothetical protein
MGGDYTESEAGRCSTSETGNEAVRENRHERSVVKIVNRDGAVGFSPDALDELQASADDRTCSQESPPPEDSIAQADPVT